MNHSPSGTFEYEGYLSWSPICSFFEFLCLFLISFLSLCSSTGFQLSLLIPLSVTVSLKLATTTQFVFKVWCPDNYNTRQPSLIEPCLKEVFLGSEGYGQWSTGVSCFSKVCLTLLHGQERPTLVPGFVNERNPKKIFSLMNKRQSENSLQCCFAVSICRGSALRAAEAAAPPTPSLGPTLSIKCLISIYSAHH